MISCHYSAGSPCPLWRTLSSPGDLAPRMCGRHGRHSETCPERTMVYDGRPLARCIESPLAIDAVCGLRRYCDCDCCKESGAGSTRDLAHGVGEVPGALFGFGGCRQPSETTKPFSDTGSARPFRCNRDGHS